MAEYNNGYAVNTRLPKDMYDWLKQYAKLESLSMGQIIRQALRETMDERGNNKAARKAKRKLSHGRI